MQIGFNLLLWTTHLTDALLPVCEKLKAAGFDGVEVPIFEGDTDHYETLARQLDDIGLRRTAVATIQSEIANPISPDEIARAAGVDELRSLVDCAHALGAEVLCGPFYQPLGIFSGTGATAQEWDHMVDAHQKMAAHATGTDVQIAVEPLNRFECYALNTNADAARLVDAVGHDNYGYLFDTFHSNIEEKDPTGSIKATAKQMNHVHISENDRGTPGRGHIDFDATFKALKASGYDGWLTIEAFGNALPDIAAATKVWRPLFDDDAQVYTEGLKLIQNGWKAA